MKQNISNIRTIAIACMLCLIAACTNDEDAPKEKTSFLQLCSMGNTVIQPGETITRGMTRADGDPTPGSFIPGTGSSDDLNGVPSFLPYNALYPLPINKDYTTIGCFLADNEHSSYNTLAGYFSWQSENKWNTTVGIKPGNFFIFGYMPSNASGGTPTITKRTENGNTLSWADGCTMVIPQLSTVSPADVCVVVGVLKGTKDMDPITKAEIVQDIRQGVYAYKGGETDNYVYLLLDHLYTNVNLELCVERKYAELRTIKLKKVMMQSTAKSTVDLNVVLVNDHKHPIKSVGYVESTQHSTINTAIFDAQDEAQHKEISSDSDHPTSVPGYFAPGQTTQSFNFEFVYDVYDRQGNLIRKNAHAVNKWSLPGSSVTSGLSFRVKATIKPTYLYQLSEADLDNPGIVFEQTTVTTNDASPTVVIPGSMTGSEL